MASITSVSDMGMASVRDRLGVNRSRRIRGSSILIGALVMATVVLWPAGCQSPPNRDDTLDTIHVYQDRLKKERQEALKLCGDDQACQTEMRQVFVELEQRSLELELQVIDEDWQDARDTRKALRDRLIEIIPQYPDIRDLLEDLINILSDETGEIDMNATAVVSSTKHDPGSQMNAMRINYDISGWLDVSDWVISGPMNFAGELDVTGAFAIDRTGMTSFSGRVTSGWITLVLPDGTTIDATVYNDVLGGLESTISTTAGVGEASLVLELDRALLDDYPRWGVLIDSPTIIRVPIEMDSNKNISLHYGPARLGDLLPYEPWPASDYNDDGQLDEPSDTAAFMSGWSAGEALADSDFDGDHDSEDIALWLSRFQEDLLHD